MDHPVVYFANIVLVASSWMAGIFVARFLMRKYFNINPDGPEVVGSISSDDMLDFDDADKAFIPVNIVHENGLYYGWFKNNNKFLGQTNNLEELRVMAHEHVLKAFGLRFEFTHEDKATVKQEKGA
jgi:hypothetical protein